MKTHNLTQSRDRNDPINRRMHGYSFCDFKDEDGIQDVISPYSLDQFLISNTSWTRKRVKKVKKSKNSQIVVSRKFNFTQKSKGSVSVTKNTLIYRRIRRNHRMQRIRPIADGASTVSHVAHFEVERHLIHPLDLHQAITINRNVHRSRLISTVITRLMDGCD